MGLSSLTFNGHTFRDLTDVSSMSAARVRSTMADVIRQYPPELVCKRNTLDSDDITQLMGEKDLSRSEAKRQLIQLNDTRDAVSVYRGDIDPITFGIRKGRAVVGGWQLWAIRHLPESTSGAVVVRARPFPAYPGLAQSQLATFVVGLMADQLGSVMDWDGGTFEVREWESIHLRQDGGRGDGVIDLFEQAYLAQDGFSVSTVDLSDGRTRWRLRSVR